MKPNELYKTKSQQEEFYGIPLGKKKPEDPEDLMAKLRMKFKGPDELLTFYERHREIFRKKGNEEVFKVFSKKLKGALQAEKKKDGLGKNDIKTKVRERIMKDMIEKDFPNIYFKQKEKPNIKQLTEKLYAQCDQGKPGFV